MRDLMLFSESQKMGDAGEYFTKAFLEDHGLRMKRLDRPMPNLPEFKIEDQPVFIDVKSQASARTPLWKKFYYIKLAKMGWKIYMSHPRLKMRNDQIICERIDWYEFIQDGSIQKISEIPIKGV